MFDESRCKFFEQKWPISGNLAQNTVQLLRQENRPVPNIHCDLNAQTVAFMALNMYRTLFGLNDGMFCVLEGAWKSGCWSS